MTHQPSGFVVAVVDDDPGILRSLDYLLESADYAVRLFSSAAALLESGCVAEVDCLISDIDLPVTDGVELSRVVQVERPALPIILITGRPELLKGLLPTSPSHYRVFKKPFDGQELLTAVSEALQNPRPREPKL